MRATGKPFDIEKKRVYEAYKAVKSNGGAAGVDGLVRGNQSEKSASIRMRKHRWVGEAGRA